MTSLEEILDRIEHHAQDIYVREKKDGVMGHYRLTELPAEVALKWACRWIREQIPSAPLDPTRMKGES